MEKTARKIDDLQNKQGTISRTVGYNTICLHNPNTEESAIITDGEDFYYEDIAALQQAITDAEGTDDLELDTLAEMAGIN